MYRYSTCPLFLKTMSSCNGKCTRERASPSLNFDGRLVWNNLKVKLLSFQVRLVFCEC